MEEVAEIKQEEEELDPPAAVFIKCGTGEIQAEGEGPLAPCNDDNSVDSPLQKARYLCPIEGVFKLAEEEETSGRTTSDKSTGSSSEDDGDHGSHDNQDDHDEEEEEEGASEDTVKKSVLARKSHYDPLVKRRVVELALSGECSVSAAARRCGREKMAACSNSSEQQEAFVRLNLLETRFTCLEESVNRAVGTLMPKVEDLLSERFQGREATSSSSPPAAAAPSSSLLELAERGDCEALLRMLADEGVDVRCNPPRSANGDTALHVAASGGQLKAVMVLLGAGARVGVVGHRLRTPLHCAAAHGHLAIAQRLLDAGARVDAKDADDAMALELAATNGFSEIVCLLVDNGAELNVRNRDDATPLERAAGNGFTEIVRFLLGRGAEPDVKSVTSAISQGNKDLLDAFLQNGVSVDACDENGEPLLVRAAEAKCWEMVKLLLEKGASATKSRAVEECALVFASEGGQADAVHHLLRRGAASNAEQVKAALKKAKSAAVVWAFVDAVPNCVREETGGLGLTAAAEDGRFETLLALLKAGVSVNIKNNGTALSCASASGRIACVRELLERGANINAKGKDELTLLHRAASGGHAECVRELLAIGADVHAKDKDGLSPLHCAAERGHVECVRELLAKGADVNAKNINKRTPLDSAAYGGHAECVRELLTKGADVHAKDKDGWTPLHSAASEGHAECVRELLSAGASAAERNKKGQKPLDLASTDEVRGVFSEQ